MGPKARRKNNEFISRLESRRRLLLCNRQFTSEFHINEKKAYHVIRLSAVVDKSVL